MNTTIKRTKEEIVKTIVEWFEENEDAFNDCIEELDRYNGYLNDDRYYCMDELNDLFCDCDTIDILNRAFFGHDAETWTTDSSGNKVYGAFNPNRDYFRFNGYGNLVSSDYIDYSDFLDHYAIEEMIENRSSVYSVDDYDELKELFDEYESSEE